MKTITFTEYLKANNHASLVYVGIINRLLNHIANPTKESLYRHIIGLKQRYSVEYVNLNIKAINAYLRFKGLDIDLPKLGQPIRKLPDSITEEYFENELIPMIEDIFSNSLKVKAILYFMFYTGVRQSEMFPIQRKDIDLKACVAKVYEKKTKKERLAVFPSRITSLLQDYFDFCPETKNAFNIGKHSIAYIFRALKPFFPKIRLHPHLFRNSFATHLLRKGVDVAIVSKLLGHSNISTTERYLRLDISLIKEVYNSKIK